MCSSDLDHCHIFMPLAGRKLLFGLVHTFILPSDSRFFLALPAGRFVDRHGTKPSLRIGITMACSGALLAWVWPSYPVLCLSALLTGGATGAVIIALQRHVGRMADDTVALRSAFSWLSVGPAASNFVGPLLDRKSTRLNSSHT